MFSPSRNERRKRNETQKISVGILLHEGARLLRLRKYRTVFTALIRGSLESDLSLDCVSSVIYIVDLDHRKQLKTCKAISPQYLRRAQVRFTTLRKLRNYFARISVRTAEDEMS